MAFALGDLGAAFRAGIYVGAGVDPSKSQLGLDVPVFCKDPGVAVGDACARHPSLVALMGQHTEIGAEKLDVVVEIAHIVLPYYGMRSEEMPLHTVAEPIASLGLHEPMLPFVSVDGPGVEVGRRVD